MIDPMKSNPIADLFATRAAAQLQDDRRSGIEDEAGASDAPTSFDGAMIEQAGLLAQQSRLPQAQTPPAAAPGFGMAPVQAQPQIQARAQVQQTLAQPLEARVQVQQTLAQPQALDVGAPALVAPKGAPVAGTSSELLRTPTDAVGVKQLAVNPAGEGGIASRLPETERQAASLGIGGMVSQTGKPWGKDWVFRPGDDQNPNLKPLFGDSPKPTNPLALVAQALAEARGRTEALTSAQPAVSRKGEAVQASDVQALAAQSVAGQSVQSLNSLLEEGDELDEAPISRLPVAASRQARASSLSGDQFLETLNAARNPREELSRASESLRSAPTGNSADVLPFGSLIGVQPRNLSPISEGTRRQAASEAKVDDLTAAGALASVQGSPQVFATPVDAGTATVTAQVTQGAMAQDRLSSESIQNVAGQIQSFTRSGTGGEIRIRLKPENLGELHLKIVTQGDQVGLRIQASDERAKKVLEESLGSLREGLASRQLQLTQFDLSVVPGAREAFPQQGQSQGQNSQQPQNPFSFQQGMGGMNQEQGRQSNRGFGQEDGSGSVSGIPPRALGRGFGAMGGAGRSQASASGRLDVMA